MNSARVFRRMAFWVGGLAALLAFEAAYAQEPVVDPPGRVARLSLIEGEVSIAPTDSEEWAQAVLNRPLTSGDRLAVDGDGRAELQVGSASIHLDRDTSFGFIELDDDVMQMSLTEGAATIRVRRLAERETVQVETPNATVFLRHTGEYHLEIDSAADRTIVKARSGEAEVVGGSKTHRVRANEEGTFTGLDDLTAQIEPIAPRTAFEAWANDRDRRDERSVSSRYVSRDVIGYEDLDDDGEWIYEPSYGHVWRPLYVAHDWAPYRYGRWAWVGPWGWTWIDDARWGFAPFHYGRWAHVRDRWCWVPGPHHVRPIYAPALVGWVGGPSVSVSLSFGSGIGWYPLGPREVYVPGYRHTPRYVRYVNESNTIIVHNTHITNIYGRHDRDWNHRHREHPGAVTVVGRDQFAGGRPVGGNRLHVDDRDLRDWRDDVRPPAIAPDRGSVLAGQPRRAPPVSATFGDNPKHGNDFRSARQRLLSGDAKRVEWQTRDRRNMVLDTAPNALNASDDVARGSSERLQIMREGRPTQDLRQRADRQRPMETRETRPAQINRDPGARAFRAEGTTGKQPRSEPRNYTPQPRTYTPAPRSYTSQPRSSAPEPRSYTPRAPEQRSTPQPQHNQSDSGKSHAGRSDRQPSSPRHQQDRNR